MLAESPTPLIITGFIFSLQTQNKLPDIERIERMATQDIRVFVVDAFASQPFGKSLMKLIWVITGKK